MQCAPEPQGVGRPQGSPGKAQQCTGLRAVCGSKVSWNKGKQPHVNFKYFCPYGEDDNSISLNFQLTMGRVRSKQSLHSKTSPIFFKLPWMGLHSNWLPVQFRNGGNLSCMVTKHQTLLQSSKKRQLCWCVAPNILSFDCSICLNLMGMFVCINVKPLATLNVKSMHDTVKQRGQGKTIKQKKSDVAVIIKWYYLS